MRGACINTKNEPEFDEQNVPELCGSRRLLLEEVTLEGEIEEVDGVLNFYLACWFDVDQVFGTHVETTENGDWINVYANYDMRTRHVCGVLDVVLHREDGSDEFYIYKDGGLLCAENGPDLGRTLRNVSGTSRSSSDGDADAVAQEPHRP